MPYVAKLSKSGIFITFHTFDGSGYVKIGEMPAFSLSSKPLFLYGTPYSWPGDDHLLGCCAELWSKIIILFDYFPPLSPNPFFRYFNFQILFDFNLTT